MKKKKLFNSSSCLGFNYNKLKKSYSKHYKQKHKFSPSCFNNCVEWVLSISFTQDKNFYSNVSFLLK